MVLVPATILSTVADLKRGQWVALFDHSTALQRIRHADRLESGVVRVEWDFGHGTRKYVRCMPATNTVQVRG